MNFEKAPERINVDWNAKVERLELSNGWIYRFEDYPHNNEFKVNYLFVPKGEK